MKKLLSKKVIAPCLTVVCCASVLFGFTAFSNGNTTAYASVFPNEQILPGDIVGNGQESYSYMDTVKASNGMKYEIQRANQLHSTPLTVNTSAGQYFDASRMKEKPFGYTKSKDESISVGVEVSSSIGAIVGIEAFDCAAKVEKEVTASLGISTTLGQGYSESITYTLNPNTNPTGTYYVATNVFVRKYKITPYKHEYVKTGTKPVRIWLFCWITLWETDVYEWIWQKQDTVVVAYPESYYYTLGYEV